MTSNTQLDSITHHEPIPIEAIKRENPLAEIVTFYGITLKRHGKYLVGLCPFHVEKTASFHVDPAANRWRCFGRCSLDGRWRDVIDFVGLKEYGPAWNSRNRDMFLAVIAILSGPRHVNGCVQPTHVPPVPTNLVALTPQVRWILNKAAHLYQAQLWAMGNGSGTPLAYLLSRGFTPATIRAARLGYCPGHHNLLLQAILNSSVPIELARAVYLIDRERGDREFLRGRIVFPNLDRDGKVTHMAGRKWAKFLEKSPHKYLALKGLSKPLYGFDRLRAASDTPVLVTESLPDWLTLLQWGMDAVCTLGTAMKEAHATLLRSLHHPLGFVAQNDEGTGLEAVLFWRQTIGWGEVVELPTMVAGEAVKDINDLATVPGGQQLFLDSLRRSRSRGVFEDSAAANPAYAGKKANEK
jgi:DNA primase